MASFIKKWLLPIAMVAGFAFHEWLSVLNFLTPSFIFVMLLFTFSRISFSDLHIRGMHASLLLIQLVGSIGLYLVLEPVDAIVAQGVLICVLTPAASSSPVVCGLLGGDIVFTTSFVFLSNICVAIAAPVIFSLIGAHTDLPFWESFFIILRQVVPLLVAPLFCAWIIQRCSRRLHAWMVEKSIYSFYLWGFSLSIVVASTVKFVLNQENPDYMTEILLAFAAFVVCAVQFFVGKSIGGMYHDRISAGQALGQKNTVVAIWMALVYTSPIVSIAPASYILWQNMFNSWQLWRKQREEDKNGGNRV